MRTHALIVLTTVIVSGWLVGSGIAQLIAPTLDPASIPALPHVDVDREDVPTALVGGLFPPSDPDPPPPPPGGPEAPAACEVPWRLVGTVLDRRDTTRSFVVVHTPGGPQLLSESTTHEELTLVSFVSEAATLQRDDGTRCVIRMFDPAQEVIAPIPAEGPSPPTHPAVTRVSSNHVEVSPDALESLGALGVRAIPYMERGALAGVRLYGVRRTSPLAAAGVQNGDVIRAVDGQPLGSPDVALAALGRLRGGSPVRVTLVRGGEAREMTLSLR